MRSPRLTTIVRGLRACLPEAVFVLAMGLSFALSRVPLVTPDTGGYLRAGESFTGSGASGVGDSTTWGAVDFAGNAFRGWPAALFYALVPAGDAPFGMWGRSALQAGLICGLTIWLALELARCAPGLKGFVLRCAIYLFALTPTALAYTFLIGAEATTTIFVLSGTALTLMAARYLTPSASPQRAVAVLGGVFLLFMLGTLVRPSAAVPLILATFMVGSIGLWAARDRLSIATRFVFAGAVTVVLVAGLGYSLKVQANTSKTWGTTTERAYRAFHAVDPATNPTFFREFRESLPEDAPDCLRTYPDTALDWGGMGRYGTTVCGPAGLRWIEDNYFPMLARTYLSNPSLAIRYFARTGAESAVRQGQAVDVVSVSPPIMSALVFVDAASDSWNIPLFYLVVFAVAAALLVGALVAPDRWRRVQVPRMSGLALLVMGSAMWLALYLSFFDHPAASNRKGWPFFFLAIVFTWAALMALLPVRGRGNRDGD